MNPVKKRKPNFHAERGQALVEFALSALVLLTLIFAIIDFSQLYFTKLTLQNAVRQGGRYAITGQSMQGQTRYASILATVQNFSLGRASQANTTICSAQGGCSSGGGPGDTVTITVNYPYRFITPLIAPFFTNGTYTIRVSSTFKN